MQQISKCTWNEGFTIQTAALISMQPTASISFPITFRYAFQLKECVRTADFESITNPFSDQPTARNFNPLLGKPWLVHIPFLSLRSYGSWLVRPTEEEFGGKHAMYCSQVALTESFAAHVERLMRNALNFVEVSTGPKQGKGAVESLLAQSK